MDKILATVLWPWLPNNTFYTSLSPAPHLPPTSNWITSMNVFAWIYFKSTYYTNNKYFFMSFKHKICICSRENEEVRLVCMNKHINVNYKIKL